MVLRSVIIDDDEASRNILKSQLTASEIQLSGEAANVADGIKLINSIRPDLVFLDIELSPGNGFDIIDKVEERDFEVIFFTGYDQYAIRAIRYSALDYLLKPVDADELRAAIQKAVKRAGGSSSKALLNNLLYNLSRKENKIERLAVPAKNGFDFIDRDQIVYLEAKNNYTIIHHQSGQKYTCTKTMKEYQEILPDDSFTRTHNSYLVNSKFIKKYFKETKGGYIELLDGNTIPVAYRRKDDFLSKFGYS
jgi:two-component system, LytTR family, response regulator